MKKASFSVVWLAFAAIATIVGCQGNPSSPVIPSNPEITSALQTINSNSHQYPAYFTIDLNKETSDVTATPLRTPDIHLNITNLFVKSMKLSIAVVPSESDPLNGLFALDFTLTHPIPVHPEFTAFDVKGIVLSPGTDQIDTVFFSDLDETRLENADGYTRWWNSIEFTQPGVFGYTDGLLTNTSAWNLTATVNPYKYFADILGPTDGLTALVDEPLTNETGRGLFSSGAVNTRRYLIRFPMSPGPVINFGYVIDGCWEVPSPNPPTEVPGDFPMNANQPEAYYVVFHTTQNTLYYNPDSQMSGGILGLQANIYDWQGQAVDNVAGDIASVEFFCPDMWAGPVAGGFLSEVDHKARYAADLSGIAIPSHSGNTLLAVKITTAGGQEYNQGFGYPAPAEPIAAWQTLVLDIPVKTCEGDANNDFMEAVQINLGDVVEDTVCLPNDYRDFYYFEIPSGFDVTGDISLDLDMEPAKLSLYGPDLDLITEASVFGGLATIDLTALNIMPDRYYIRVYTTKEDQLGEYSLNLDATVTDIVPHNPVDITQFGMSVNPERIWWNGNYLYMIGNEQFWIYDMTDPYNPQGVYYDLSEQYSYKYTYYGNYIYYIYHESGSPDYEVNMLDVSDPYSPVKHQVLSFGYQIGAIAMNSTNLYIADFNNGPVTNYLIYDWSADPLNPTPVGLFVQMEQYIRGMELMWPETSTPVLLSNFDTSLVADDVEDPGAVFFLDKYNCTDLNDVAVHDQFALCVGTSPLVAGGLFALSFDLVGGFSEEGVYDTSGFAVFIDTQWPYAYIGDGTHELVITDLTNIAAPVYEGTTPLISNSRDVAVNGSTACVISYDAGVEVFDATTPSSLLHLERLGVANATMFIFVDGDYLFTSEYSAAYPAVKALDITDPANIYIAGEYLSTHGEPHFMDYSGGRIILGTGGKSFEYINASDPMNMTMIESQTYVDDLYMVSLYNDYMYLIVDNGSGYELHIYEQDGFNPMTYIDFYDMPFTESPGFITCHDDYLFVPSGSDVYIYSLAFPEAPALIGKYSTFSKVFEAKVQDNFMYLSATNRLEIADFSDPLHPDYLGSVQLITNPVPYSLIDIELDGQIAYTGGMTYDSYICNIWPPDNPTLISELPQDVSIPTATFELKDGYLFRGCFGLGIRVHDLY